MNSDAQEAAMGLLSLSPNNIPPPSTIIPQKRKYGPPQSNRPQNGHHGDLGGNPPKRRSTQRIVVQYIPPQDQEKENEDERERNRFLPERLQEQTARDEEVSADSIRCICGSAYDDGFSIACDDCSRWCHAACFGIVEGGVPEEWRCWVCLPRPVDRERAVKLQRERRKLAQEKQLPGVDREKDRQKRRMSPGVDRRHRRAHTANNDAHNNQHKRKRASMFTPVLPTTPVGPPPHDDEVDDIDIDDALSSSYVSITHDIISSAVTLDKLRKQAKSWRGVTAIEPWSPPPISVQQVPVEDSSVRPPSFAVHTTKPIPSEHLITPFVSSITPSSAYLSDPLNAYAHLGMPKPFVHLMGPPLDLALDARTAGDKSRFVRSGCRPNAVLRPVLCRPTQSDHPSKPSDDDDTLSFAVFAARDLKADEEVVLGWEWDDGNAVHKLPALIQTPGLFPPQHRTHLRAQMRNILHVLTSTFTTCACGSRVRDCALAQMERFVNVDMVNGQQALHRGADETGFSDSVDLGPLIGTQRGFRTAPIAKGSGGMGGVRMWEASPQYSPLADSDCQVQRGDDVPMSFYDGGQGVEPDGDETEDEEIPAVQRGPFHHYPRYFWRNGVEEWDQSRRHTQKQFRPPDPVDARTVSETSAIVERGSSGDGAGDVDREGEGEEERWMPPKMRKRWIQKEAETLKEIYGSGDNDADVRWEMAAKAGAPVDGVKDGVGDVEDTVMADYEADGGPFSAQKVPTTPAEIAELAPESSLLLSPHHDVGDTILNPICVAPPEEDIHVMPTSEETELASSPASPDLPPAASPPLTTSLLPIELDLTIPAIRVEVVEDEESPRILRSPWSPLRRVEVEEVEDLPAEEPLEIPPAPPAPIAPPRVVVPQNNGITDYYPELRSDEDIPPLMLVSPAPEPAAPPQIPNHRNEDHLPHSPPPSNLSPSETPASPAPQVVLPALQPPALPPPPKVKMSLKDFAARRRRRKEGGGRFEGASTATSVTASPVITAVELTQELMSETGVGEEHSVLPGDGKALDGAEGGEVVGACRADEGLEKSGEARGGRSHVDDAKMKNYTKDEDSSNPGRQRPGPSSLSSSPLPTPKSVMSLKAKSELTDPAIPPVRPSHLPPRSSFPAPTSVLSSKDTPHARPPSGPREDGKSRSSRSNTPPVRHPPLILPTKPSYTPSSHTPPTHPRSFSKLPGISTASPPPFPRPPPSGPRALRMSSTFQQQPSQYRSASSRPFTPSQAVNEGHPLDNDREHPRRQSLPHSTPRGPSADRDKLDGEREGAYGLRLVKPGIGNRR